MNFHETVSRCPVYSFGASFYFIIAMHFFHLFLCRKENNTGFPRNCIVCAPLILSILFLSLLATGRADAQTSRYEVLPSPDIWYNDVDGIRLGVRLKGQVPGTFEDGPHRLDAGIWVGTWLPKLPLSYYISYTEPINAWSEYGSEANVQAISSIRTGYHNHGIGINKRWQQGFDERRYIEIGNYNSFEKRVDSEYVAFPMMWSERSKLLSSFSFNMQNDHRLGWYQFTAQTTVQFNEEVYGVFNLTARQRIDFNDYFGIRLRGFMGIASSNSDREYLFTRSMNPAIEWIGNGVTRAKGTIPQPWIESGNIHVAGGGNLRGYTSSDIGAMVPFPGGVCVDCSIIITQPRLFSSFASVNAELDYWNPLAKVFNEIPYASEFLSFRSYLFFDAGRALYSRELKHSEIVEGVWEDVYAGEPLELTANAGAGFSLSLNIPDYHGKPRGFVLRYEIPFWLSHPGNEDSFKLRHLVGFGAVVSF